MQNNKREDMACLSYTLLTSDKYVFKRKEFIGHSGSSITGTYAGRADLDGHRFEFVICVDREQRPFVQYSSLLLLLLLLRLYRTVIVREDMK